MTYMLNIAACYLEQKKFDECISLCKDAVEVGRENYNDFKLIAKAFERIAMAYKKKGLLEGLGMDGKGKLGKQRQARWQAAATEALESKANKAAYIDPEKALEAGAW